MAWRSVRVGSLAALLLLGALAASALAAPVPGTDASRAAQVSQRAASKTLDLNDVAFASAKVGWVVGDDAGKWSGGGLILKTTDGGSHWARQKAPWATDIHAVAANGAKRAWAACYFGIAMRTVNGGARWTGRPLVKGSLEGISFPDARHGWAAGEALLRTTNGGASWTKLARPDSATIEDVAFASAARGWMVNAGGKILGSSDGGKTWRMEWQDEFASPEAVKAISGTAACVVGNSPSYGGLIMRTTDGGVTWVRQAAPGTATWLMDVDFVGPLRGWAVDARQGAIIATSDGGTTWVAQGSTGSELTGIDMVNERVGYVSGARGLVLKTSDGGAHWKRVR